MRNDRKNELFALNRIYASEMGIDFSLRNDIKDFDVILGNPPWEKIRFEERKFWIKVCSGGYHYVAGNKNSNIREISDTSVGIRPIFNTYNHSYSI